MFDFQVIAIILAAAAILAVLLRWYWRAGRRLDRLARTCKDTEGRYRTILESVDGAFILYDPNADVIADFNSALCDMFGYAVEEIRQLKLKVIYSGAPPYSFQEGVARHQKAWSDSPQVFEWLTENQAGQNLWIEIRVKSVFLPDRKYLLFLIKNITERKATETRLYRLINVVDQIGEGVATSDLNGIVTYVNQMWANMHGYSPQTLPGKHLSIFHDEDQNINEVIPFNRKVLRKGFHSGEIGHVRSDGTRFFTHMTTTLQRDESGRAIGFIGVASDLSDQKKIEDALRESEIKFRYLFNLSPQPISLTDLTGKIIDVNEKFCQFVKHPRQSVIHKKTIEVGFPAEEYQCFTEKLTSEGDVSGHEMTAMDREGFYVQVQLYAKMVQIRDDFFILTVYHDVTAQRSLESQLIKAQKMEAIGTLAGGIAHDFNNILSAILGYIELSRIHVEPENKVRQYLEEVFKAGNRARELVRQILSISRQTEQKRKPVDINRIIVDVSRLLRATLPSSIEIRENLDARAGLVEADSAQIHQVIMNLGTNAGQSMKDTGGVLTLATRIAAITPANQDDSPGLKPGNYLKIIVSDTGRGIPPEDRKRIFDPYYTTKEKQMGTGLGLAVAQGIVQKHGGSISFSSRLGKKTEFFVYLPAMDVKIPAEEEEMASDRISMPTGTESILLVDDEESIIDTGKEMLEFLGYRVETCMNSMDALNKFRQAPECYDLVISDMTMPEMDGDQLAIAMMSIQPNLPVILCTGYNPKIDESSARRIGIRALVFKPLTFQQLALHVRSVLDQNREAPALLPAARIASNTVKS